MGAIHVGLRPTFSLCLSFLLPFAPTSSSSPLSKESPDEPPHPPSSLSLALSLSFPASFLPEIPSLSLVISFSVSYRRKSARGRSIATATLGATRASRLASEGPKTMGLSFSTVQLPTISGGGARVGGHGGTMVKCHSPATPTFNSWSQTTHFSSLFKMVPSIFDKSARIVGTDFWENKKLCKWIRAKQSIILR